MRTLAAAPNATARHATARHATARHATPPHATAPHATPPHATAPLSAAPFATPLTSSRTLADLLCVDVGRERFALPLQSVEEMVDGTFAELTTGPGNRNHHMVGVMRVREVLLPVYDAARIFGANRTGSEPMALVLQGRDSLLLLLVDGAEAAPQVDLGEVRTPERLMSNDHVLEGVVRVNGRWVGLLNTGALIESLERDAGDTIRETAHAR